MTVERAVEQSPEHPAVAATSIAGLGAVFTRRWVADLILDLAGYTADQDLAAARAVEPAVGHGAFVVPMAERLAQSCRIHGRDIGDATAALAGFDIDPTAVGTCRDALATALTGQGVSSSVATHLARGWLRRADFLDIAAELPPARWVIGNPPYVRVEQVDKTRLARYRAAWTTMSGRADLYVGFLEAGLSLLEPEGRLAVICADRWMRNRYGAGLRRLVEDRYAVDVCAVLHDVDAFDDKVAAYPAVTILRAGTQTAAMVGELRPGFAVDDGRRLLAVWGRGPGPIREDPAFETSWTNGWFADLGSWPAGSPRALAVLSALETRLPTLCDTGAVVAVGVATGADGIYLTKSPGRIEPDRLLPALSAREISTGRPQWAGRYLVNPWDDDGLATLDGHPGMAAYLRRHARQLKARHIAQAHPRTWWRTIDRVHPRVARKPKLLIPDLKDRIHPVIDHGEYYPSHSLYYVTSDTWDLAVLGGLLLSDLANLFIEAYSVRMANGYLRVSAQYLRRIRVPHYTDIDEATRQALRQAFARRDVAAASAAAARAYRITDDP